MLLLAREAVREKEETTIRNVRDACVLQTTAPYRAARNTGMDTSWRATINYTIMRKATYLAVWMIVNECIMKEIRELVRSARRTLSLNGAAMSAAAINDYGVCPHLQAVATESWGPFGFPTESRKSRTDSEAWVP